MALRASPGILTDNLPLFDAELAPLVMVTGHRVVGKTVTRTERIEASDMPVTRARPVAITIRAALTTNGFLTTATISVCGWLAVTAVGSDSATPRPAR
jgi:hypothetical protein